ncbi:circularly permuted type 2 ATP-grasp protein [Quadrisphaera setariae]|uniref:Circularly permuted type 2 ATP-grasp protein n=1 Tax=Quadrisphaera setariae TaxID=2593304 RepID=A0A5C8ZGT0_9ACTN|nr:circularly permuted type 2 ATP-grasp protein [Quadrisphaera setariae]TXR57132.1 circularly permuted type 2 ATP-grasp protein [Quadrisphaera setariae]
MDVGSSASSAGGGVDELSGGLFDGYGEASAASGAWDEMFTADGSVREASAPVHAALASTAVRDLRGRADALATSYTDKGITFAVGGEERPFPLDVVPRVVSAQEWAVVEAGVAQRVRALEAFLADAYGPMRAVEDGVVPRGVITSSSHFHRVVAGIEPPNGVRVHVAGVDLIRDADGVFRVLEDNVRVPSGVSYVLTNRSAMAGAMPEAFSDQRIRPVAAYPRRLLAALRAAAPVGIEDPTVVVLTPGVYNSAYFEHALLARSMGIELVEGRDLVCRGGRLHMRTTAGLRPVHVVYRRVDDEYLDPVHFRSDSMLGCPGLLNAARAGNVTIANGIGNGVADDKLLYTYVPDLVRYYLDEEPVLPNVPTWRLEEREAREEVFDRLAELVVKPVDGSGGKGIVIGPAASPAQLEQLRARVSADPRGWIAQPVVRLSTVPTLVGDRVAPRHVDLRPFAVNDGSRVWVLPGGLTRVALPEGELVVNSSQGGGSKDTWVLADDRPDEAAPSRTRSAAAPTLPGAPPDRGPGVAGTADVRDQQQQQQQAAQTGEGQPC